MKTDLPILDWHINENVPEAIEALAEAGVAEFITSASDDPIYRQLDLNYPKWKVYGPSPEGAGWTLMEDNFLHHPNIGTLIPMATAVHGSDCIIVYRFGLFCIVGKDLAFTVGKLK